MKFEILRKKINRSGKILGTRITLSPVQTQNLGRSLAKRILQQNPRKALLIGLSGDLGGGKTTFLKGLARGLGIKGNITSPTFVIYKRFQIKALRFKYFYHIDCYRIAKPKELIDLGFRKIISNPQNIVAIEWAERVKKIVPKNSIWIKFEFLNQKTRKISISYF